MESHDHNKELQLLPSSSSSVVWPSSDNSSSMKFRSSADHHTGSPSLDLQLSISLRPIIRPALGAQQQPSSNCTVARPKGTHDHIKSDGPGCIEALKWQAAEQIRIAGMEKAYAERVREMTRREMELAQSEFSRARHMWERAREEVDKAEKLKERATRRIDSRCMEITCQACRQKFRPS